ncbi:MAG: prepilin peptidase [Lachnospiraceae bacterium]|nr:prepilin peptidase [Lachnospiraceae bacterium]
MNNAILLRTVSVGILLITEGIRDIRKNEVGIIMPVLNALAAIVFIFVFKDMGIPGVLIALAEGIFVIILSFLTKEGIGLGDGIILCSTGLMLGWKNNLIMIFIACFISAFVSVLLMIFMKADKKTKIPFVPFMIPAFLVTIIIRMT